MIRAILAVIAGLAAWAIVATGLDLVLRAAIPGYAAAEPNFDFTLAMMIARLALPGAVPSLAAGFVAGWISRGNHRVTAALAVILVASFAPAHYHFWTKFPVWYHGTFFGSLVLLAVLGARLWTAVARRPVQSQHPR